MKRKKPRKWMQGARNPRTEGKFSAKARRAGMSTHAYAEKERHASGKLGKEARLALVYEKYRPGKKRHHKRHTSRSRGRA